MEAEGKGVGLHHSFDTRGYLTGCFLQSHLRHLLRQADAGRGKESALAGTERTAAAGITATTADLDISMLILMLQLLKLLLFLELKLLDLLQLLLLVPLSIEATKGFLIRGSFSTLQANVFSRNPAPLSSDYGRATILAKCCSAVSHRVKLSLLAEVHLVIFLDVDRSRRKD